MGKTKAFSIPLWKYNFIRESTDLGKFHYTLDLKVYNTDFPMFGYLQFAGWHLCEKRTIVEESIIWSLFWLKNTVIMNNLGIRLPKIFYFTF